MAVDQQLRSYYLDTIGIQQWRQRGVESLAEADLSASGWPELQAEVAACSACTELAASRRQMVFGVGDTAAEWMVVGEAPSGDDDTQGEPFTGQVGQLLNAMLAAIGLPRESVYTTNLVKCMPPGSRKPSTDESERCRPFLQRQIELVEPRLILVLGEVAAQSLLQTDRSLAELSGQVYYVAEQQIPLVASYHPAYLLQNPNGKRQAWEDLKLARHTLEGLGQ